MIEFEGNDIEFSDMWKLRGSNSYESPTELSMLKGSSTGDLQHILKGNSANLKATTYRPSHQLATVSVRIQQ